MHLKRILSLCCALLTGLLAFNAHAQQSSRFRPDNEAFFLSKDAAANQLYSLSVLHARASFDKPIAGVSARWASEELTAQYLIALAGLKTDKPGAIDTANALIGTTTAQQVRDRLSLAIARYYFVHGRLAAAIPYYESAGIANLSNVEIADTKFELAYCYFNNRQFDKANTLLSIMKEVPGRYYSAGNYYYGLLAYTQGDYAAALKSFDRIKDEPVYRPVVPYYMAEIYYFMGDRDKALSEALRLIKQQDKLYYDNELHLLAAQCLFESGRYGDALPYFEYYYEHTDKIRKEELYEMGYAYYRVNEWKSAIEKFKPLSAAPDSLGQTAMYLLGDCYLKTGDKESARNAFGICATMPYNAGQREAALLLHAKLSYETGFADEAMRSVRVLLADFPNGPYKDAAQLLQSQLYLETNNYKDAYETLTAAKNKEGDYARIYQRAAYGFAMQQMQAGKLAEAGSLLSKAFGNPASADYAAAALFWKAELSYRLRQYDSAVFFAQEFLKSRGNASLISPAATPAHASLTLGYAAMELKDFKTAQSAFSEAKKGSNPASAANASLREADAYFMQKEFAKAAPLYTAAADGAGPDADYAKLQSAIIAGLRGDEAEKSRLLQAIMSVTPPSPYAAEARYELGVSQIASSQFDAAVATLQPLIADKRAASFAAKALLKTGTAQQQLNQDDKALETYRRLLHDYPAAPERADALSAAKSIYIERNQPDAYTALLREYNLPQASDEELEAAYYNAAEVQYAAGKWEAAAQGFRKYLGQFPAGAKADKARFYLANSLYTEKSYSAARAAYDTVLQQPWGSFSEESAVKAAELSVADTAWLEAARYYGLLAQHATSNTTKVRAYTGLMHTAAKMNKAGEAARYADSLLLLYDVPPPIHDEALMHTVRQRLAAGDKSPGIDSVLKNLAQSGNGLVAAEARYLAAQNLLNTGKLKEAETAAGNNIRKSAGYEYWVVKSYLLLSDILVAEKDYFNAKATLQSIVRNSRITELKDEAARRLDELKTLEKSKLSNE
jgi:tetratricopeptide (TPR) repeat protein